MRWTFGHCVRIAVSSAGVILIAGCAAPANIDPAGAAANASSNGVATSKNGARNILPNTDNGLEVLKWSVVDQPGLVLNAVTRHMDGEAVDPETQERLERNGFRFARVPMDRVAMLLEDLGGAGINLNEWHGQAPDWRPLQHRSIGPSPRAIAIDGRVARHDHGTFAIDLRSWTVQMENGPFIHVEVVPRLTQAAPNDLRRLLGDDAKSRNGSFASMALDLQLESGFAYVLFGESPQTRWPNAEDGDSAPVEKTEPSAPTRRQQIGPVDATGAETAAPVTLGEFLLVGDKKPAMRGVIVLVPKISPSLFPPGALPPPTAAPVHVNKNAEPESAARKDHKPRPQASGRPADAPKQKGL